MLFEVHHPKENSLPFAPQLSHFQGDDNKRADCVMQDSWFSLKKSHLYLHTEEMDKTGIIEHSQAKKNVLSVQWKSSIKQNYDVQCFTEKLICGWVSLIGCKTEAVSWQECNLFLQTTVTGYWREPPHISLTSSLICKCWVELGRQLVVQL